VNISATSNQRSYRPRLEDPTQLESLLARVRGEYFEMPGLRVTFAQACRLWQVDVSTCEMLLDQLIREGFLWKTNHGFYIAVAAIRG
jgi:hypothetical protein